MGDFDDGLGGEVDREPGEGLVEDGEAVGDAHAIEQEGPGLAEVPHAVDRVAAELADAEHGHVPAEPGLRLGAVADGFGDPFGARVAEGRGGGGVGGDGLGDDSPRENGAEHAGDRRAEDEAWRGRVGRGEGKVQDVAQSGDVVFGEAPEAHAEVDGPCRVDDDARAAAQDGVDGSRKTEVRVGEFRDEAGDARG